ncbi:cation transporter [Tepiditoga spiralis]|uniref:Cation transporter n=1 Tax=Tepiditoga spiralis TaxID=2108365 RepID=A0A7G1G3V9_9BACT|nr:HlyD family efflux transporter periplasmic adaptor subunit [Tepiditoga spiralis]BBE30745.1 cation transporter [Tepiditoga spiralis]
MKKSIKWLIIIVTLVVLIFLIINALNIKKESGNVQTDKVSTALNNISVEYKVKKDNIGDYIEVSGNVTAETRRIISEVSGEVMDVYVENGEKIKKDQKMAKFEDIDYRINYLNKLNTYELAVNDGEKIKEIKKLQLDQAKKDLDNTILKSPVEGIISSVNISVGDVISRNFVSFTVVDNNSLKIEASIDEIDLPKIKVGMKAYVEFEQLHVKIPAKVSLINPVAVNAGGIVVIPIELKFEDNPLKYGIISGLTCNVKLITMELDNSIVIPVNSLIKGKDGNEYVFKKTSEGREKVPVITGQKTEKFVEIKNGLSEGDTVLIMPSKEEINRLKEKYATPNIRIGTGKRPKK